MVNHLLTFSQQKADDDQWLEGVMNAIGRQKERNYINEILAVVLLDANATRGKLYDQIYAMCLEDLTNRVNNKPQPPANWTREVPQSKYSSYQKVWEMLRSFLESPTEKVFEYRKAQAYRSEVMSAISNVTIDLTTETIKRGSPHTLRITKTQAAYELKLKKWKKDEKLLAELEDLR